MKCSKKICFAFSMNILANGCVSNLPNAVLEPFQCRANLFYTRKSCKLHVHLIFHLRILKSLQAQIRGVGWVDSTSCSSLFLHTLFCSFIPNESARKFLCPD